MWLFVAIPSAIGDFDASLGRPVKGQLIHVHDLTLQERRRMFRLLAAQFAKPSWDQFEHDLERKDWIIQVRDTCDELCGFTSLKVWDETYDHQTLTAVYSGDTIL